MAYQVLYRTYRPQRFEEVVGQKYVIKTLLNAIQSKRIAHAYLFAGPRGTGKTTIAKLFAKAINCENFNEEACDSCKSCNAYNIANHPDIIELDAASNNSVENIREIIDQVPYAPMLGKYKVYIIDEVHMLSASAFNALLKTLEEPPAHVVFILATTDPQKVIPTVLSRCQRYNFSKLTAYEIKSKLIEVLEAEHIAYEEKAVEQLSRLAEGGMRDALSLLEQCLAYNHDELKEEDVERIFGLSSTEKELNLYLSVHDHQVSDVIREIREMYQNGIDTKRLAIDLLDIIKETLIYSDCGEDKLLNRITRMEAQEILNRVSIRNLLEDAGNLQDIISREKQNQNFLVYLELAMIQMAVSNEYQERKEPVSKEAVKEKAPEPVKKTEPVIETPVIETPIKTEEEKPEIKEDKPLLKEIPLIEEEETEPLKEELVDVNDDLILNILFNASRDIKINDQIIYNRMVMYELDEVKRKYYQLLNGTELYAASKDAIIILSDSLKKNQINTLSVNKDLYRFISTELGIDKMIYAIDNEDKNRIIDLYRKTPVEERNRALVIDKYDLSEKKEETKEDLLDGLFGNLLKVEE
ncbi:MAG: DNA polymerase III subunit gamma/tau [Erysipelotrichaceae bacterium]|nr:DNA polymerase III subunit gamma/tau [Erysipelotrichaceae bacterium]